MVARVRPTGAVQDEFLVSDEFWARVKPLVPPVGEKKKDGRPRMDDRKAFQAIYYVLRTGIQWNALPRASGASSTVFDRFCLWRDQGLFESLWLQVLLDFEENVGLDLRWQSMDGAMTKAPLGGEKNRPKSNGPGQVRDEAKRARGRARLTHRGRRGASKQE